MAASAFLVDDDPDSLDALGQLGGLLFVGAGVSVLISQLFLDRPDERNVLVAAGLFAVVVGLVCSLVPWHRWKRQAILVETLIALCLMGCSGRFAPGVVEYYLNFFIVILAFVGMSQSAATVLRVSPLVCLSFVVAASGKPDGGALANFFVVLPIGVTTALLLATMIERQREANSTVSDVLFAAQELSATTSAVEAAVVLQEHAVKIMQAAESMTIVAERPGSNWYTNLAPAEPGLSPRIDIDAEPRALANALAQERPTLISDAATDERLPGWTRAGVGNRSMLHVPLPGEGGRLGVLVVVWDRANVRLDRQMQEAITAVAIQGGRVIERHRAAELANQEATTDALTGLGNRRAIDEGIGRMVAGDAVVLLDLDWFKSVNDRHGHRRGDQVLQELARCLSETCRDEDWSGRLGGEEFIVVYRGVGSVGAVTALRRLRAEWTALEPLTTFSAGVAVHEDGTEPAETMANADAALYLAKRTGRDRFEVFDPRTSTAVSAQGLGGTPSQAPSEAH